MSEETKPTEPTTEPTTPTSVAEEPTTPTEPTVAPTEEPTEPTEPTNPTEPPVDVDNIEESLKEKGFDYQELLQEYADNGDLTEETRAKLAEIGLTKEFVDDFINGKKAIVEQQIAKEQEELAAFVGGKENLDSIIKWAAENMSEEEKLGLNDVKNMAAQKLILEGLKSRMENKEGVLPSFVQGGGQNPSDDIFESQAQMFEAIRDKRYLSDPAYQEKVTKKIQASRKAGINLGI